jgi:hypothetical protein
VFSGREWLGKEKARWPSITQQPVMLLQQEQNLVSSHQFFPVLCIWIVSHCQLRQLACHWHPMRAA